MKRRSPWLTFAACALMSGTALARPVTGSGKTSNAPSITEAARAAEAELGKRGLSPGHIISSLALVQPENHAPFYVARIQPPVFLVADKELSFRVTMDGQISEVRNAGYSSTPKESITGIQ